MLTINIALLEINDKQSVVYLPQFYSGIFIVKEKRTDQKNLEEKHSKLGTIVGLVLLMMWICKTLYGTRKSVLMYSGFSVSRDIVGLKQEVVCGALMIKMQGYWPKCVHGAAFNVHFKDEDVNHCDMIGTLIDDLPLQVMCMKEPNYVIKIMWKWMTLDKFEGGHGRTILWKA